MSSPPSCCSPPGSVWSRPSAPSAAGATARPVRRRRARRHGVRRPSSSPSSSPDGPPATSVPTIGRDGCPDPAADHSGADGGAAALGRRRRRKVLVVGDSDAGTFGPYLEQLLDEHRRRRDDGRLQGVVGARPTRTSSTGRRTCGRRCPPPTPTSSSSRSAATTPRGMSERRRIEPAGVERPGHRRGGLDARVHAARPAR